jgi:hypothetical protein
MSEPLQPREVRDVEELRALAHPMRQRILRQLIQAGPVRRPAFSGLANLRLPYAVAFISR